MKGLTESEMLWNSFLGNEAAMEKAIDKGDLKVMNGMYYWSPVLIGKSYFSFGGS